MELDPTPELDGNGDFTIRLSSLMDETNYIQVHLTGTVGSDMGTRDERIAFIENMLTQFQPLVEQGWQVDARENGAWYRRFVSVPVEPEPTEP